MIITDIPADLKIRAADLRAIGLCVVPGAQRWGEAHGFDFRTFIKEGISAREVFATGDEFGLRAVKYVMEKNSGR